MIEVKHVYWMQYQVTVNDRPKAFAFSVRTDHESVEAFAEALNRGLVPVDRLSLADDGRDGVFIIRSEPTALGREGLVNLRPYRGRVWESQQ